MFKRFLDGTLIFFVDDNVEMVTHTISPSDQFLPSCSCKTEGKTRILISPAAIQVWNQCRFSKHIFRDFNE
jgi:hypothetical protein